MSRQKKQYNNSQNKSRGGGRTERLSTQKRFPGSKETPKTYGLLPYKNS